MPITGVTAFLTVLKVCGRYRLMGVGGECLGTRDVLSRKKERLPYLCASSSGIPSSVFFLFRKNCTATGMLVAVVAPRTESPTF